MTRAAHTGRVAEAMARVTPLVKRDLREVLGSP